jgi:hypothetical protein
MFSSSSSKQRRAGIFYVLTISLTLLLLAASSIPTSAQPTTLEEDVRMQSTKLSDNDKTAVARAKKNGDRDRNRLRQPTAVFMMDGAENIFGPDSGELVSVENLLREETCAEVDVRNFIAHVRVFNPTGRSFWEFGVIFRKVEDGDAYFWLFSGQSRWFMASFEGGQLNQSFGNGGTGSVPNMDLKAGGFNDVTLIVQEDYMLVNVNGEYLSPITLQNSDSGDICLTIDNLNDVEREGRSFQYENFLIDELP